MVWVSHTFRGLGPAGSREGSLGALIREWYSQRAPEASSFFRTQRNLVCIRVICKARVENAGMTSPSAVLGRNLCPGAQGLAGQEGSTRRHSDTLRFEHSHSTTSDLLADSLTREVGRYLEPPRTRDRGKPQTSLSACWPSTGTWAPRSGRLFRAHSRGVAGGRTGTKSGDESV